MKGLIYVLRTNQTDGIYYGSTTQRLLCQRLAGHKNDYKRTITGKINRNNSAFDILKYDVAYIELIEEFEYNNIQELKAREKHYIRNNACVNKYIPLRTTKEWKEDNREHYLKQKQSTQHFSKL